ncbi:MAG: hypothetical protein QGI21_06460 [Candidatus Poseidoniaceae archaeon]|nr:hypothetical protein [Candidatus Poseidoniaceae archaeon]
MAWPFGNNDRSKEIETDLSEERLKMMANIAIEQVAMPEQGTLSEEDAWTISPGPTRALLSSMSSMPQATPTHTTSQVTANLDTSGIERLISNRLDMVEDVLRSVEVKLDVGGSKTTSEEAVEESVEPNEGDTIVTASGEVLSTKSADRMMTDDAAPLLELYEAQALAANPFLVAPAHLGEGLDGSVGAPTVAALLLDNLSGMAAVSFTQKAMSSGMLSADEGKDVLAIVQMASPGEAESALEDHLPHRELLTFSALVSTWRRARALRGGD